MNNKKIYTSIQLIQLKENQNELKEFKIKNGANKTIEERIELWIKQHARLVERWQNLLVDIQASQAVNFVAYSVILRELFDFAKTG